MGAPGRAAGTVPRDWPRDELDGWKEDIRTYRTMLQSYEPARYPDRLEVPPAWPATLVGFVGNTVLAAVYTRRGWLAVPPPGGDGRGRGAV